MTVAHEQMDKAIEHFQSACETMGIAHRVAVEEGDPCNLLIDLSRYHDLVAFSVPGLLAFGHPCESQALLGPLVSSGVRPLLAVTSACTAAHGTIGVPKPVGPSTEG